jgi:hypothetical protein
LTEWDRRKPPRACIVACTQMAMQPKILKNGVGWAGFQSCQPAMVRSRSTSSKVSKHELCRTTSTLRTRTKLSPVRKSSRFPLLSKDILRADRSLDFRMQSHVHRWWIITARLCEASSAARPRTSLAYSNIGYASLVAMSQSAGSKGVLACSATCKVDFAQAGPCFYYWMDVTNFR